MKSELFVSFNVKKWHRKNFVCLFFFYLMTAVNTSSSTEQTTQLSAIADLFSESEYTKI